MVFKFWCLVALAFGFKWLPGCGELTFVICSQTTTTQSAVMENFGGVADSFFFVKFVVQNYMQELFLDIIVFAERLFSMYSGMMQCLSIL